MERIFTSVNRNVALLIFIGMIANSGISQRYYKGNYKKKAKNSMAEGTAFVSWATTDLPTHGVISTL